MTLLSRRALPIADFMQVGAHAPANRGIRPPTSLLGSGWGRGYISQGSQGVVTLAQAKEQEEVSKQKIEERICLRRTRKLNVACLNVATKVFSVG